jgi:hypothetical protein
MASNNGISAGSAVIRWLWAQIENSGILSPYTDNYQGFVPIVPIQDEPGLLSTIGEHDGVSNAPYIVYTWYNNGIDPSFYLAYDTLVFTIKSNDQKAVRQLILLMKTIFRRYDESAQALNRWVARQQFGTLDAEYKAYSYKYISVWALTGGVPGTMDLEPVHANVTIRVGFTWDGNSQPLPELP